MARGWVDFWLMWIAVDLVGVPLFGIEDRSELAIRRRRGEEMLALLPSRVRKPKGGRIDDDF